MSGQALSRLASPWWPWAPLVNRSSLRADLIAGVLGALLVLPQGVAFATLAGLPPEYGLYTAIVPCVIAALFGASRHVVSGPTNANSLALFAMLSPLAVVGSHSYIQLALAVTVLVGLMQLAIGVLRLGTLANFISPAALRGFTTGAAVLIVLHALNDLLGLAAPAEHGSGTLLAHVATHLLDTRPGTLLVGGLTLVAVLGFKRLLPRWPFMLLALAAGTALATALNAWAPWPGWGGVAVVGRIPSIVPQFQWPVVAWHDLSALVAIAFALTIVALGQSISIAKAVAARSGQAIDANREFVGQGLSNLVGGFFSSYVSCGSLNRSMPNLEAGARTPLAAVFSAFWLLLLVAFTAPVLALIPRAAIAALLLVIAWSLVDLPGWRRLGRLSREDLVIALVTALATVSIRIEMAILLGTMLSLVRYLYRTSRPQMRVMGFNTTGGHRPFVVRADTPDALPECPQLTLLRMEGEVYFGAVSHVADQLRELRARPAPPRHLLVMAKSMNFIDLAGAELWQAELAARRAMGGDLYFHRPRPRVLSLWARVGFMQAMGPEHVFASKRSAIAAIFNRLDRSICANCRARVFEECASLPPAPPPVVPQGPA